MAQCKVDPSTPHPPTPKKDR